jgi:hypothetical protein
MSSMVLWKYAIDPICKPPTKRHGIPPISTTELGHEVPQVPRFLCDEMLHGLGRWLRAAGYDTVIATRGLSDRELAARCAEERRVLLTKDRHLAAMVTGTAAVVELPGKQRHRESCTRLAHCPWH